MEGAYSRCTCVIEGARSELSARGAPKLMMPKMERSVVAFSVFKASLELMLEVRPLAEALHGAYALLLVISKSNGRSSASELRLPCPLLLPA